MPQAQRRIVVKATPAAPDFPFAWAPLASFIRRNQRRISDFPFAASREATA
jgi:hypothetical protein